MVRHSLIDIQIPAVQTQHIFLVFLLASDASIQNADNVVLL